MVFAYSNKSLDNKLINEKISRALHDNLISKEEYAAVKKAYPEDLYTPNVFIQIGIFLLSVIIILMGSGLLTLMTGVSSEKAFGALSAFSSLMLYPALEFIIRTKKHYRSGLDGALLWLSAGFFIAAVNLFVPYLSYLAQAILIFITATFFSLRFAAPLMSSVAFLSLLAIVFYSIVPLGDIAKAAMPFILMAISFSIYFLVKRNTRFSHYRSCNNFIQTLSLITAYAAVNFFVVREVSNELFGLHLRKGSSIPGGWFFWSVTVLMPPIYMWRGLQKKDVILLRTGMVLLAATIFTINYYYQVASLEIFMTIAGAFMIVLAYAVTKYFRMPKHGITHKEPNDPQLPGMLQLEALVISQSFYQPPAAVGGNHPEFGGGSGGGAGATGQF